LPRHPFGPDDRLLLVSDLHLADEAGALTEFALEWILEQARQQRVSHLWILGDLFDAWVGDDQLAHSRCAEQVAAALRTLAPDGVQTALMVGNRDFLIGSAFVQACQAQLLSEIWSGRLPDGRAAVICHGDQLCLDDADYLRFRTQTRAPEWQQSFLAQPIDTRLAQARQMREMSESHKAGTPLEMMDIRPAAAEQLVREHGAGLLIHGHTHRPGCSPLGHNLERWVLPDWHFTARASERRGGGLLIGQQGIQSLGLTAC